VRAATGLSCSVGLAPNKLLAKICSDLDKPDGLTVVMAEDVASRIWPLPVRRIHGVGPKAGARLESLGVHSIGDLAGQGLAWLSEHFGAHHGEWLLAAAQGHDDRPVVTESEPVSMSRETTFERDLHPRNDRALLGQIFTDLCERVGDDLRRKGYVGRTIGIKLRFDDFRTVTRDHTVELPTADGALIRMVAGQCLKRINLSRRLRLLGVRVGNLSRADGIDAPLMAAAPPTVDAPPAAIERSPKGAQRKAATARIETSAQTQSLPLFPEGDESTRPGPH
jgi:DNA polymerase IV